MNALKHVRPAFVMAALFILLTGLAYPLAVTGVAGVALPYQANGSPGLHRPGLSASAPLGGREQRL